MTRVTSSDVFTDDDPALILTDMLKDRRALANRAAEAAAKGLPLPATFTEAYDPRLAIRLAEYGLGLLNQHRPSRTGNARLPYCSKCSEVAPCRAVKELCRLFEVTV